ncbi:hypothetical protein HYX14_04070 [Candidatus Woesearchaeota archaeon]|nr:hypothetical protein [Candidatus Woesearchaeota archaeon]
MGTENVSPIALFFDAGPIITLVMARLWWILPELKKRFGGKFYITPAVRKEVIERPLNIRRFQFEALQVQKLINDGVFDVYPQIPTAKISTLIHLANAGFSSGGKTIDIIQSGEMESVSCAVEMSAGVVMDERTLRLLIENSSELQKLLEVRFHKQVDVDLQKIREFQQQLGKPQIVRSSELISVAYQMGLLSGYAPKGEKGRTVLLDSVLWNAKFNGCAITEQEIEELKKVLLR